jgi:hypothetical protein
MRVQAVSLGVWRCRSWQREWLWGGTGDSPRQTLAPRVVTGCLSSWGRASTVRGGNWDWAAEGDQCLRRIGWDGGAQDSWGVMALNLTERPIGQGGSSHSWCFGGRSVLFYYTFSGTVSCENRPLMCWKPRREICFHTWGKGSCLWRKNCVRM